MIKDINIKDQIPYGEYDRIVVYLKGKMSQEEEGKFLKDLEENAKLKENAIIIARLVKGLKEVGREKDRKIMDAFLASNVEDVENVSRVTLGYWPLEYADYELSGACPSQTEDEEEAIKEDDDVATPKSTRPVKGLHTAASRYSTVKETRGKSIKKWLAVAASLVLVVWFGVEYGMYRTTTGLGEQYDDTFTSGAVVRGAETQPETSKKLEKLFADVKGNKNIDAAIHDLTLCWELSTMDTYNDYTDYSAEIGWYLAIAHLKDNDRKGARKVLEKLVKTSESGSAINRKAKEVLEKL